MTKLTSLVLAGSLLVLSGCADLKTYIQTQDYSVRVCAQGIVVVPCKDIGTLAIPSDGESFANLVVALGGPFLAQEANLENCVFTAYPAVVDTAITVTATAVCKLNNVPVNEALTVSLVPVIQS